MNKKYRGIGKETFDLVIESSKFSPDTIEAMRLVIFEKWTVEKAAGSVNKKRTNLSESLRIFYMRAQYIIKDAQASKAMQRWLSLSQSERDSIISQTYKFT